MITSMGAAMGQQNDGPLVADQARRPAPPAEDSQMRSGCTRQRYRGDRLVMGASRPRTGVGVRADRPHLRLGGPGSGTRTHPSLHVALPTSRTLWPRSLAVGSHIGRRRCGRQFVFGVSRSAFAARAVTRLDHADGAPRTPWVGYGCSSAVVAVRYRWGAGAPRCADADRLARPAPSRRRNPVWHEESWRARWSAVSDAALD